MALCAADELARLTAFARMLATRLDAAGGRRWDQHCEKPKHQCELRTCRRAGGDTESTAYRGHAVRNVAQDGKRREMPKPDCVTERYS